MVSTAAFHARVRGSVPGLGGLKETKTFLLHPRVKVSIVGSLRDRKVACSASDRQGSNFESCVWRRVSSQSSHHPQEVLLAQFSLYVHKSGLKPDSFHLFSGVYHHQIDVSGAILSRYMIVKRLVRIIIYNYVSGYIISSYEKMGYIIQVTYVIILIRLLILLLQLMQNTPFSCGYVLLLKGLSDVSLLFYVSCVTLSEFDVCRRQILTTSKVDPAL